MPVDKYLDIYDENGNPVDYDIRANDVKFQDGQDLPAKLDAIEQEIDDIPGYAPPAGGIPATDLDASVNESLDKADTAYQKPASGIPKSDLAQGVQDSLDAAGTAYQKPASGIPSTDMSQAVQDALAEAGSAVQPGDMATINGQSITEGGNISIPVGQNGVTPHIGANGNWWIGPETDPNNDTGVRAQGPQGVQGNVHITDGNLNSLEIANVLDGNGDVLGVGAGVTIRSNITSLYNSLVRLYQKLANMAFWSAQDQADAEPDALDWNIPQVMVSINNGIGANSIVKAIVNNTAPVVVTGNSLQIDMGAELVLTIEATEDCELSNVDATVDGVTDTPTESGGVYTLSLGHVNANTAIVISGTSTILWFTVPKNDVSENGNVTMYGIQQGRSIVQNYGYMTPGNNGDGVPTVIAMPAAIPVSQKVIESDIPVGGVYQNSNPGKVAACFIPTGGKKYLNIKVEYSGAAVDTFHIGVGCYGDSIIGNTVSDYINTTPTMPSWSGRISYSTPNSGELWKFDLHTQATSYGKNAGDITYIKMLLFGRLNGTNVDSRAYFDGLTVKYKFTDD